MLKNELMTTKEVAELLRRKEGTVRRWACYPETSPIGSPVRSRRRAPLLWRRSDVEKFIEQGGPV
jgi:hypothetical protein